MKTPKMLYENNEMDGLNWLKINQIKTPLFATENLGKVVAIPRKAKSYQDPIDWEIHKPKYDVGVLEFCGQNFWLFGIFTQDQAEDPCNDGADKLTCMIIQEEKYDKRASYYTLSQLDASKWRWDFFGRHISIFE